MEIDVLEDDNVVLDTASEQVELTLNEAAILPTTDFQAQTESVLYIPIKECHEPLVSLDPTDFILSPIYYEWGFAETPDIQLRAGCIPRLKMAQKILQAHGPYSFKIWDGFRSLETQKNIYEAFFTKLKQENPGLSDADIKELIQPYVSLPQDNPLSPAFHNTGGAVDLTIVDEHGVELPMGTEFDDFTEASHLNYFDAAGKNHPEAPKFHANRMLLKEAMESAGFADYDFEWWHFSYGTQDWATKKNWSAAIYGKSQPNLNSSPAS